MNYVLVKDIIYGKLINYELYETVYKNEEEFLYNGREVTNFVNKFNAEQFEEVLKENNYDYLKTVNDLHFERIDNLIIGF